MIFHAYEGSIFRTEKKISVTLLSPHQLKGDSRDSSRLSIREVKHKKNIYQFL